MACAVLFVIMAIVPVVAQADVAPGSPHTVSGVVSDVGGTPINDVVVELIGQNPVTKAWSYNYSRGYSTADGSYLISDVPAGTYRVLFTDYEAFVRTIFFGYTYFSAHTPQAWRYQDLPSSEVSLVLSAHPGIPLETITVPNGAPGPSGINASMTPTPASISGHVHNEAGDPVTNVSAILYGLSSTDQWQPLFSVPVGTDGGYVFRGISTDVYFVGFGDETTGTWDFQYYRGAQQFNDATAILFNGTERTGIDATLTAASVSVTGTVTDAVTGERLAGMRVSATSEATSSWAPPHVVHGTSGADGSYELRGLVAGRSYSLEVDDPDLHHSPRHTSPVPYSGGVLRRDLTMQPIPLLEWYEDDLFGAQYPAGYADLTDVVVTSLDSVRADETLNAPGLCWAYQVTKTGSVNKGRNAPLLTASGADATAQAELVSRIALDNGTPDHSVTLHVVASYKGVPDVRLSQIRSLAASKGAIVRIDRLTSKTKTNSYDIAEAAAKRMKARASLSATDAIEWTGIGFVVNGDDPSKALGPLSCSAVAAARGAVLMPVAQGGVPKATARVVTSLHFSASNLWVVGDTRSVSEKVRKALHVAKGNRLQGPSHGSNRFTVAVAVARLALARHWLTDTGPAAIAAISSDAAQAAAAVGDAGGPLLLDEPWGEGGGPTMDWVRAHASHLSELWFIGFGASNEWIAYEDLFGLNSMALVSARSTADVRTGRPLR